MKSKYFLLVFFISSLFIFSTTINVRASDYQLSIQEGSKFVYTMTEVNEKVYQDWMGENLIGEKPELLEDYEVGNRQQYIIKEINEAHVDPDNFYGWELEYDSWDWTDAINDDNPDSEDSTYRVYKDPNDLGDDVLGVPLFAPTPIDDYLKDIDWNKDAEVNGKKVTFIYIDASDWEISYPDIKGDVLYEVVYNDLGVIYRVTLVTEYGDVIFSYSLNGGIPGYELPILLGVTGVTTIGIIYIMMKKKN